MSHSQTTVPNRLASLFLIGAFVFDVLCLLALAVRERGYRIEFGSKKKTAHALPLKSLARWWYEEKLVVVFLQR